MPNIASNTSPTGPLPSVQRTDHSRRGAFLPMARGLAWDVGLPVAVLVTAIRGRRPLTLAAAQSFMPARAEALTEMYDGDPDVRRAFRLTSAVWGIGLLAEAVLRIPLVVLLPVEIGVGASEGLFIAAFLGLMVWNGWYVGRVLPGRA